ncbi:MAG: hypothetical protein CMJ25_03920 [Phycisphaerae bacterium]|nr:hypothetical protein [Phycisphaerae bacterium]|tara:strand:- start:1138 stop:1533 length:396 start_codon:yes stop_codon:yes gene_type:complete
MKHLLSISIIYFLLVNTVFAEQKIYYCSDEAAIGFNRDTENSSYDSTDFIPERFTAKMNFETGYLIIEKYNMIDRGCKKNLGKSLMSCNNNFGYNFIINTENLKYSLSKAYGWVADNTDSLVISYGICELF